MTPRATVLYDGQCSLCVASVRRLRALDWTRRLDFDDARDPVALARHPGVEASRALTRMQLVAAPGAAPVEGFAAMRWIAANLPALWFAVPLLWALGILRVGDRLYDGVARHRWLFGSCADACAAPVRASERPGARPLR
jgi:predicted DCC family thiol-disulfide oxidoreductase YuxK